MRVDLLLNESTIVAVGRLVDAHQSEITLEVEEGLRGVSAGDRLTINNRHFGLGADCSVYVEPRSNGFALPEEARVIAFLRPDVSQRPDFWMPAFYGWAVWEVGADDEPFGASQGMPTIEDIRGTLASGADAAGDAVLYQGFGGVPGDAGAQDGAPAPAQGEVPDKGNNGDGGGDSTLAIALGITVLAAVASVAAWAWMRFRR
jgi:hypothetical protein